ncbi:hypothetical protein JCM3766R1_005236 [Sporobolomyces carnicolor]
MDSIPAPIAGGLLLSFATSTLLAHQGRILGCSGVTHSTLEHVVRTTLNNSSSSSSREEEGQAWKVASVLGLVAGGIALSHCRGALELVVGQPIFDHPATAVSLVGLLRPILAGFAVGLGTKLAKGCTSGHFLIGFARLSKRSIAATLTFFPTALLTARSIPYPSTNTTDLRVVGGVARLDLSQLTPEVAALVVVPFATLFLLDRIFLTTTRTTSKTTTTTTTTTTTRRRRRIALVVEAFTLSFVFSIGLALTGMLRPSKVLSFFYVPIASSSLLPPWDPSLAFVALGGLVPNFVAWTSSIRHQTKPTKRDTWDVPTSTKVDLKLLSGSVLFGIGWGLMGICPGPMLVGLGAREGGKNLATFASSFAAASYAAAAAAASFA